MKKKFLIPLLAMFTMAMVFSFSNASNSSQTPDLNSIFIESDNIAYAEIPWCRHRYGSVCVRDSHGYYNYEYFIN
jgi:hypothetical protein